MGKIKIRIYPNGYVEAQTVGIKGKKCKNYKPFIEKLFEGRIVDEQLNSEYFEDEDKVQMVEEETIREVNYEEI